MVQPLWKTVWLFHVKISGRNYTHMEWGVAINKTRIEWNSKEGDKEGREGERKRVKKKEKELF